MRRRHFCLSILSSLVALMALGAAPVFDAAIHPRQWSFPRDHGRHDGYKVEWWYFTGNLHDAGGRQFGYQLTFFRSAFVPQQPDRKSPWAMSEIYFAHAAISDISTGRFVYKDQLQRARPGLAAASDRTLDVMLLDWLAKLEKGSIHLYAADKGLTINLNCNEWRGPFLEGPGGVNTKGREPGQASYYYSMTRLKTTGTLTVEGKDFQVNGQSWMDHEFSSNALGNDQVGWDWMGLQLNDGNDVMVYRLRNKQGGTDYLSGTRVGSDGEPHYLAAGDISIEGDKPWTSPTSGGKYPQQWKLRCAGLPAMIVRSQMPAQELITSESTKVTYFEGAADVFDELNRAIGQGYLEMTGYAAAIK